MPACGLPSALSTQPASSPTSANLPFFQVLVHERLRGIVGDVDVGPAIIVEVADADTESVGAAHFGDARAFGHVRKRAVAIVVVEDVGVAVQSGRPARYHHGFIEAGSALGNWRRLQIEINVVGDEEIELSVAIVIEEGAACSPADSLSSDSCFLAYIGEGAVAVVVIQHVLAEVGDEQVVVAVVVVIADADALSPPRVLKTRLQGDVGESPVAIVLEEVIERLLAGWKAFESSSVDEEDVEPAIVVIVVKGDAAACGFEQVFVLVFAAERSSWR